ncbi:MAG: tetratricopeptide repeat protein [Pyrinomonadaceae bacterium]|nr:tetratricopeptide repeat protein [Pyrinomonadaceae bacterium]
MSAICVSFVAAQEIVPVSDLTGGSSLFVFRGGSKSVSRKYVSQARSRRSTQQRRETVAKVNSQYAALSKAAPRRSREKVVNPDDPALKQINTMPREEASKLFAGVGEYYMDRSEFDQAIDVFRESINLDSTNAKAKAGLSEALALKGNELLAQDSQPLAKTFYEEALTYNPKNAPAYFGLAEIASEAGDDDAASANYERSLEFDKELTEIYIPLGILYYRKGNIAKADQLLTNAVAIDPKDATAQHFVGLVRLQQNRELDAARAFDAAKTLNPANAESFYYSGETQMRLNNNNGAIEDFKKAIDVRKDYFEAWYGLGSAYFELENYKEAVAAFEQAKRLRNTNPEVVANLGDAYRQLGDYNQAESNYNLAVIFFERTPGYNENNDVKALAADINARIGFVIAKQCELNRKRAAPCKWDTAVAALEKAVAITGSDMDRANLGWAYYNAGVTDIQRGNAAVGRPKLEKARDNLVKVVSSDSVFLQGPLMNLGRVQTELGDHKSAIVSYKRVVDKDPKSVNALRELGTAYYSDSNFKEAANVYKRAVDRDDKNGDLWLLLGRAQFKSGNVRDAQKTHEKLKSIGRNDLAAQLLVDTNGFK